MGKQMKIPSSFQEAVILLEKFWSDYGCLIWHPYNSQVGAGTMNPATALRVLGPEPWKVAYLEPSIRPDDGRYGINPNRLQQHYQYQVVLQPTPCNPQEIYLQSLEVLGIDMSKHDIRFVEDNWEQPAIGAWGLGWEVWLDGQEITQFTYFQQVGGITLESIAVEITYGLERILIALQDVDSFRDIRWSGDVTYEDMNLQSEQEHSRYYFESASVDRLRSLYDLYSLEALSSLEEGLVLPAYDYALKCSHTFNILDTRGSVGTAERAVFFSEMRSLVKRISQEYIKQRKNLDYPLLRKVSASESEHTILKLPDSTKSPIDYLLEIGVEELPVGDLDSAIVQMEKFVPNLLLDSNLSFNSIEIDGTPRRLVVQIKGLLVDEIDSIKKVRGPALKHSYDSDGNPTNAAKGFARSQGVDVEDLEISNVDGGDYVVALVTPEDLSVAEILVKVIPDVISNLNFNKSMRWLSNENFTTFSRPIRWIVSLLDKDVLPFSFAGVKAGRQTRGLRSSLSNEIEIQDASSYESIMVKNHIVINVEDRKNIIQAQGQKLALTVDCDMLDDEDLLGEVANLIESPKVFIAKFSSKYVDMPDEILMAVMKKHQRYFPLLNNGTLTPFFLGVHSSSIDSSDIVVQGNEKVVSARFADAKYFVEQDIKYDLDEFRHNLDKLIFEEQLGSMLDKSTRIEKIAIAFGNHLGLDSDQIDIVARAAYLSKFDLATQMVIEMTSLQGVIGREYALRSGESHQVANAIEQHYWPKKIDSSLPDNMIGTVVGLADRLDSLVGLMSVGLEPTGTADPFGQRKMAIGTVQLILGNKIDVNIKTLLEIVKDLQPVQSEQVISQAMVFIEKRLRVMFIEQGFRHDVVDSVLCVQGSNPWSALQSVIHLNQWVERDDWSVILDSFARCVRILPKDNDKLVVNEELFESKYEQELWDSVSKFAPSDNVDEFLNKFVSIVGEVTSFFDEVLVMDDNMDIRLNRIALVRSVSQLAEGLADLSKLNGF